MEQQYASRTLRAHARSVAKVTGGQALAHASLWRRVAAFAFDALLLGIAGHVLGLLFYDEFVSAGAWGRVIGFLVALVYFSPLDSRFGGGQTLGKRITRIRVVDAQGRPLGLALASARAVIVGLPFFVNGSALAGGLATGAGAVLVALLVFGLGGALLYLFAFNRRTRQSVHDWMTGSYVVTHQPLAGLMVAPQERADEGQALWRGHRIVIGTLVLMAALTPLAMSGTVSAARPADRAALRDAVAGLPEVRFVGISEVMANRYDQQGERRVHVLTVSAVIMGSVTDPGPLPEKIVARVLANCPDAGTLDLIEVVLAHGYDIGLASNYRYNGFSRAPVHWRQRIAAQTGFL